jgi:methylmalonyl-CoA mutase
MLRTSTEYMSAILGGADSISTQTYDTIFKKSNAFSNRIARNQLLVLREENGFDNAQENAKGSYYIENLTIEIAKKSLLIFKELEKQGGFLSVLKSGKIQTKIQEAAQKEQILFEKGILTLLGTNKFPNSEDKMKEEIELYPFLKPNKKQTLINPILSKRLSEEIEQIRLSKEE